MKNITVWDLFCKSVEAVPEKPAVIDGDHVYTYGVLNELTQGLISDFLDGGVEYQEKIGVLLPNGINFVRVMLAASFLGAVIVPMNPTLPPSQLKKAFEFSDVKHLVGSETVLSGLEKSDFSFITGLWLEMVDTACDRESKGDSWHVKNSNRLQELTGEVPYIQTLTSGSTGDPKPIVLTQKNKVDRARAAKELYDVTEDDVILAATPLYHSLAERLVLLPLVEGATSVILPRFTPKLWLEAIEKHKVSFTIAVSSQLAQIAEALASPFLQDIRSLRCVVSSSALLENHIKWELISKLDCDFHECYGTSEVAIATNINITESKEKLRSVGRAAPDVKVKIFNEDGREALCGEIGEIQCKTPMVFKEYYKLPELTKEAFNGDYFKTGDYGYLDEDQYLYFVDRKKDIIITGGINVYPNDIESHIKSIAGIEEAVAFPYPDNRLGEIVAVALVLQKDKVSIRDVKVSCAKNLADYQQPIKYFIVDEVPKNNMGKLMKRVLIEKLLDGEHA